MPVQRPGWLLAYAFLTIASLCNTHTHITHIHITEWADAAAGSGAFDRDAWVKRELSVTLVRGNARLFKKFVGVLNRGIGQRFVEGMDVPVLE